MPITTKPTVTGARALGGRLKTKRQAIDALKLTLQTLGKSIVLVQEFSLTDKLVFAKVQSAWLDRIRGQMERLRVIQKRLAKGFTRKRSDEIAMSVLQAQQLLKELGKAVTVSRNASTVNALRSEFADAMRRIVGAVLETVGSAVPWYVWAVGLYLLTRRQPSREDLRPL